jgi:hypothetical protein
MALARGSFSQRRIFGAPLSKELRELRAGGREPEALDDLRPP